MNLKYYNKGYIKKSGQHRYLIEVDFSLGQFKSSKMKDKEYSITAPIFSQHCKKRKIRMHQIFNICWQMVSCWFMLLKLYLPLLYICGQQPVSITIDYRIFVHVSLSSHQWIPSWKVSNIWKRKGQFYAKKCSVQFKFNLLFFHISRGT